MATSTFRSVFEHQKIYEAPIFQRRYKWDTGAGKEVPKFWDDLENLETGVSETLFLGAIITKPSSPSTDQTVERSLIVDGQQRLTTVSVTLLAAAILSERYGATGLTPTLIEYLTIGVRPKDKGRPKIIVTTPDLAEYEALFRRLGKETQKSLTLGGIQDVKPGRLTHLLDYSMSKIESRIESPLTAGDRISDVIKLLLDRTEFVEIQLEDRHDPNEVFDRLNRRGTPLTVADLVRNHVFAKLSSDRGRANDIYKQLWEPFEKKLGDRLLDDYFFPFAITRFPQTTKSKAMDVLSQRWDAINQGESDHTEQVENIVDDLSEFVEAFLALREPTADSYPGLPISVSNTARRLERMSLPSVTLPFPMQVLRAAANGDLPPKDAVESLEIIESFLVRRALVGMEATGLHAIFKVLWDRAKGDPSEVRKRIESQTIQFPDDNELRKGIEGTDLYGRRLAHYILEERELSLRTGDPLSEDQLRDFQIDHVAPQSRKGDWAMLFSSPDAEALLGTWGNLVPLSQKANSTKNAMSWDEAKKLLRLDTVYKTTWLVYEEDDWKPEKIEARNRDLATWAISRWPYYEKYL